MNQCNTSLRPLGQALGIFLFSLLRITRAEIPANLTALAPERITASASSWQIDLESYNTPQRAVEGVGESYCWWETREPTEQWLQLDLGDRYRIGALEIQSSARRMNGYRVHVSNDPEQWGDAVTTGNLPNTSDYHPIVFEPTYGRYITLVETSRHTDGYLRICDVRVHASFALENPLTGSRTFTSTNEVNLIDFPTPEGYDLYQVTESNDEPVDGWLDLDPENLPDTVTFSIPDPEGLVTLSAWFAHSTNGLPTIAVPASITYRKTDSDVQACAVETISVYSWGAAHPATILVEEIDAGSSESHGLSSLAVACMQDQAPEDPQRLVLVDPGTYQVTLSATDLAGNVARTNLTVTVLDGTLLAPQATSWTGAFGTGNWFHHGNWSDGVPGPGSVVTVGSGAEIRLAADTAVMGTFTMSGGTLDMQNWSTRLRADAVNFAGGTIRPYQSVSATYLFNFDETEMSNRVWIVCGEYTQGSGATINANGRGYRNPHGPGCTMGTYAPGGGHGGLGAWARNNWENIGRSYGSIDAPEAPGSGAGRHRFSRGGLGGGAVRIDATGRATISGTIQANGTQGRANQGGGGSGGSILIQCQTLAGAASGLLSAAGGDARNSSGGGGGGRIAVIYDSTEQGKLDPPFPAVRFSAKRGLLGATYSMSEDGTLYLPDLLFLAGSTIDPSFMDVHVVAPGLDDLVVEGTLTIAGQVGLPTLRTLDVRGDLILAAGGSLRLYGGEIAAARPFYGTLLRVAGELRMESGSALYSTLYAFSHPDADGYDAATQTAGRGGVLFDLGRLTILEGGVIDAVGGGFWAGSGPGAGRSTSSTSVGGCGGSYGGLGGGTGSGGPGPVYGVAHMPLLPGSGGNDITKAGRGGGLLVFQVAGTAHVDGLIQANGQITYSGYYSGGSGGGIVMNCGRLAGIGEISASGATTRGGGGRVAVWHPRLPMEQLLRLAQVTEVPTTTLWCPSNDEDFAGYVQGGWEAFSGKASVEAENGSPGSIFFARYYPGTMLMIR